MKVRIYIGNSVCVFSKGTSLPLEVQLALKQHCSFQYEQTRTYRAEGTGKNSRFKSRKVWLSESLYSPGKRAFKTGLLDHVLKFFDFPPPDCPVQNFSVSLVDKREPLRGLRQTEPHPGLLYFPDGHTLRDYQVEILSDCRKYGRGIVFAATSAGKTAIGAGLIKCYGFPKSVFLVNRSTLVDQQRAELEEKLRQPVGIIAGGAGRIDLDHRIAVCTIQTLASRLKIREKRKAVTQEEKAAVRVSPEWARWADSIRLVIGDEIHNASDAAGDWIRVIQTFRRAPYRFGLSGTPFDEQRPDRKWHLISVMGPVVGGVRNKDLAEQGVTAKLYIMPRPVRKFPDLDEKRKAAGSKLSKFGAAQEHITRRYRKNIVENRHRNDIIEESAREMLKRGVKTMILCNQRDHVREIERRLKEFCPAIVMGATAGRKKGAGGTTRKHQEEAIARFRENKTQLLIATTVVDEGFNVPDVQCAILAGAGVSSKKLLQRTGRVLRGKADGPNIAFLIDMADYDEGTFQRQYYRRRRILKSENAFTFMSVNAEWSRVDRLLKQAA